MVKVLCYCSWMGQLRNSSAIVILYSLSNYTYNWYIITTLNSYFFHTISTLTIFAIRLTEIHSVLTSS